MVTFSSTSDTLITTYLEMTSPAQAADKFAPRQDAAIEMMNQPDVGFYRFLYRAVGEKWRWRDRLQMSASELHTELSKPTTTVHVLYVDGSPAGYIELAKNGDSVEIAYFGLREEFHGRGLGKYLLSYGVEQAWELGAKRVWLHTCNLDGPHALRNYQKRGFKVYMRHSEPMPEVYL